MYSPLSVRLLLGEPADAGKISGGLFAISSLGNIVGIIVTTFVLIPSIGTRAITAGFAMFLLVSGFVSLVVRWRMRRGDARLASRVKLTGIDCEIRAASQRRGR